MSSDPSRELQQALTRRFQQEIAGEFSVDSFTRALYATDASIYQITPVGVVAPRSVDDVRASVAIAREFGLPIIPRGGGTSLSGQSIGPGLVLDFSRYMHRVLDIDAERGLARVQPGVVLDHFNQTLKPLGWQFGPDVATSSRANLGGMVGNNSAGSRSVWYGKVVDHVRELDVILSDGHTLRARPLSTDDLSRLERAQGREAELVTRFQTLVDSLRSEISRKFPRILRRVSGYNLDEFVPSVRSELPKARAVDELDRLWRDRADFNLSRLFVGAEGTLGVVTEAVVHLVRVPAQRAVVALEFATIDAALECVPAILATTPSAVELLDHNIVTLSRQNLKYKSALDFVAGTPEAILIVEWSGDRIEIVRDLELLLEQKLRGATGLTQWHRAATPEQRDALWNCRKAGAPLLLSIPGARKPIAFVEDTAVSPAKLPAFTRLFKTILDQHGLTGAYYGHASVGCLHIRPMVDTKSAADRAALKAVSDAVAELVREFGGAMTGEHGDGLARSYHNLKLFGPALFEGFRAVKSLFDPLGLMNPGKVTATPSPIDNLRYGDNYRANRSRPQTPPLLSFAREERLQGDPGGGLLAAAEMCNGAGVCRKTLTGTMCPSYMVTLDEEQSTRGRANALRMALSGQLPEGSLTSPRMHEVFDLCLMCKACKAECPSNVDVAKMKVEFLARSLEAHGTPLATRLLANVAWLNRVGSALAPVSNWILSAPGVNWLNEWLLGVDHRRALPKFARQHFASWFDQHHPVVPSEPAPHSSGKVVLLDDCLTSYCEPGINRAATEVLERLGYAVTRANLWCCGRPFLSKGMVHEARRLAARNITRLADLVAGGATIVGSEPSCVLTLIDEYPDLIPGDAALRIREATFLLDEFLARPDNAGRLSLWLTQRQRSDQPEKTVLIHGHCQQKALRGNASLCTLIGLIPGATINEVDSGCCGMAGAFGYEHHDVSLKMGERALFPEVRVSAGPVVAAGFSCRHQIAAGTGKRACHPVELLAATLKQTGEV
jgi:FAD/FMN-containing dehydrogenase/Fe-S oxidoreductase